MEHNVVTLETAKKLKAAGFPQDASFNAWFPSYDAPAAAPELTKDDGSPIGYYLYEANFNDLGSCAAPTAQELADQLPLGFKVDKRSTGFTAWRPPTYSVPSITHGHKPSGEQLGFDGDTMAEALAALWLKLKEAELTEDVDPDRSKMTPPKEQDHEHEHPHLLEETKE